MPYLGFIRSDLCSICAADGHAEYARAACGLLGADSHPLADDDSLAPRRVVAIALSAPEAHGS